MNKEEFDLLKAYIEQYNKGSNPDELLLSTFINVTNKLVKDYESLTLQKVISRAGGTIKWEGGNKFTLEFPPNHSGKIGNELTAVVTIGGSPPSTDIEELKGLNLDDVPDSIGG